MGITDVLTAQSIEICDNAKDDDLDGLIDINDPDCDCMECCCCNGKWPGKGPLWICSIDPIDQTKSSELS